MSIQDTSLAHRTLNNCHLGRSDTCPIAISVFGATPSSVNEEISEIVVTRLDVEPEVVRASATLLAEPEHQRASQFAFDRDRCRFIVCRARLRRLLSARLGVPPESVELVYGRYGKPALAQPFRDSHLRFNVSHSNDVAVYAFATRREIGVDVEAIRVIPDADNIAARFFSRRENEEYLALDPDEKPIGFFNCWTRKEAFIKAIGDGLHYPLDHFDVSLAPGEAANILRVDNIPGDLCGWSLQSFCPAPGFVAAVASERDHRQQKCISLLATAVEG